MSNLSITNLLSQLQNSALTQQQVTDATTSGDPTTDASTSTADGQNVPTGTATTTSGTAASGASTPLMSSDMTAVLLQMQQSQEMTDAQALLYGDGSGSGNSLVDYLDGNTGNNAADPTTDPMQALLAQLTGTSSQQTGSSGLMSANQSLLDYLNAMDTNGASTTATATAANGVAPNAADSQTSANSTAMLEALYSALGQTSPAAATTSTTPGTQQAQAALAATTTG